jgi:hypothetical protein
MQGTRLLVKTAQAIVNVQGTHTHCCCLLWLPLLVFDTVAWAPACCFLLCAAAGPMKFTRCRWHPNHTAVGCLYAVAQQGRDAAYVAAYQVGLRV